MQPFLDRILTANLILSTLIFYVAAGPARDALCYFCRFNQA